MRSTCSSQLTYDEKLKLDKNVGKVRVCVDTKKERLEHKLADEVGLVEERFKMATSGNVNTINNIVSIKSIPGEASTAAQLSYEERQKRKLAGDAAMAKSLQAKKSLDAAVIIL